MVPWTAKTCLFSFLAVAATTATVSAAIYLKKRSNVKLPPMAALKSWDVVKQLTSPSLPVFQFETGLELHSPVYRLPLPFGKHLFVVMDAVTADTVLRDDETKPSIFTQVADRVFNGPVLLALPSSSLHWQQRRKAQARMFAAGALAQKVPLIHGCVDQLVSILDECCETQEDVDIVPLLLRFALDIAGLAILDYDLQSLKDPLHSDGALFLRELQIAFNEFAVRQLANPFRRFMFWDGDVQRAKLSVQRMHSLSQKTLVNYQQRHSKDAIQNSNLLIAELVRNPHYPRESVRAAEATGYLAAGHDTTSNTMAWALYDLACHPEIAAEVYAEVDDAMRIDSRLSASQSRQLRVLDACIKESMRLWPVFGIGLFRETTKAIHYKDMVIPAGSMVSVAIYGVGRWPEGIEDLHEYRPHRWLGTQAEIDASEERFIAFGRGRRICIGQELARMELRLVLARLLHRYKFEVVSEPTYYYEGTSKPLGLKLRFCRRN